MDKQGILSRINSPDDVKKLNNNEIPELSKELRSALIKTVLENGGHLASNLGVVELTVALSRVFDFPKDKVVFDVGHQSYVYKMLTGRYKNFDSLRNDGGISGFPSRSESEYDFFGTGHAGTSISAALGFAEAERMRGGKRYAVAVVGDGAYTCGIIHEALNNCSPDLRLIIVINENEMSISKNIGGFARYMAKVRSSRGYYGTKDAIKKTIGHIPVIGDSLISGMSKIKSGMKSRLYSSNIYEDMGITYLGPCDGNDYEVLERVLKRAKSLKKCCVVHIKTVKGKGYPEAEKNPGIFHGLSPRQSEAGNCQSFSDHFGKKICEAAEKDTRICAITAAMADGTGLVGFSEMYPERFFDVGIAEEHGAVFAAGLSAAGMKPVYAVYSTFLQRAYDNLIHDIALQRLPVVFCLDRAGLAVRDGATHHGIYDVSMVMSLHDAALYAPLDFDGFDRAFKESLSSDIPAFIRYRNGSETKISGIFERFPFVRASFDGKKPDLVITYGAISEIADKALHDHADDRDIADRTGLVIVEKLKGDDSLPERIVSLTDEECGKIVIFEEGVASGSFGEHLIGILQRHPGMKNKKLSLLAADPAAFSEKGRSLYESCHISENDLIGELKG